MLSAHLTCPLTFVSLGSITHFRDPSAWAFDVDYLVQPRSKPKRKELYPHFQMVEMGIPLNTMRGSLPTDLHHLADGSGALWLRKCETNTAWLLQTENRLGIRFPSGEKDFPRFLIKEREGNTEALETGPPSTPCGTPLDLPRLLHGMEGMSLGNLPLSKPGVSVLLHSGAGTRNLLSLSAASGVLAFRWALDAFAHTIGHSKVPGVVLRGVPTLQKAGVSLRCSLGLSLQCECGTSVWLF